MKLNLKEYKTLKIKNYFKNNEVLFLVNGLSQNSFRWVMTEQELKKISIDFYKISNRASRGTVKNSVYQKITPTINGTTFFFKPTRNLKTLTKHMLLIHLKTFLLDVLAIKFNNKLYSINNIKQIYSLNYIEEHVISYQFRITNLKLYSRYSKQY